MKDDKNAVMTEILDMLKSISDKQIILSDEIKELRQEQKRIKEEIRLNNFVLNNMNLRNEILN